MYLLFLTMHFTCLGCIEPGRLGGKEAPACVRVQVPVFYLKVLAQQEGVYCSVHAADEHWCIADI